MGYVMFFKLKYFLALSTLLTLFSSAASAYDGIVIVLEAPLLKGPSLRSIVLQTVRKGERVYVPREIVKNGMLPEFVPTFDRTGNRAYVPGRYLKVVLGTEAEERLPITIAGHDPTDYRLEEPIPATYPYQDFSHLRTSVSFIVGNSTESPYAYNNSFTSQEYNFELGGRLTVTKKVDYDKYDRFYFGFIGMITSSKNSIDFKNSSVSTESRDIIRLGPWFTYDAFKNEKYRLALGTGFTFNYHKSSLYINGAAGSEQRFFTGFSIAPMVSSNFQVSDILPYTDLIGGMDLNLFLPHTLKADSEAQLPELWGESNQIDSGIKAQATLFLGVQVKY
jgi:hypothetical protein